MTAQFFAAAAFFMGVGVVQFALTRRLLGASGAYTAATVERSKHWVQP